MPNPNGTSEEGTTRPVGVQALLRKIMEQDRGSSSPWIPKAISWT